MNRIRCILPALIVLAALPAHGDALRVATASNFRPAMLELARQFEADSGHEIDVIAGSTGKHFAQIVHGAPFDLFFAADGERPQQLELRGLGLPGGRFRYALGILVLWSPQAALVDSAGAVLREGGFRHLAIANPVLAPYGRAAMEVIEALGVRERLQDRLVRGENVAQALQFVDSGNAELGFVALSQLLADDRCGRGSCWKVDAELYGAIEQQALLLSDKPAAREFLQFVQSPVAAAIIQAHGYELPAKEAR
jgi:molybdate transport system substrate-binding protein